MDLCAGPLYIEVSGVWEEMFFSLKGPLMVGKEKLRGNIPSSISNSGEIAVEVCSNPSFVSFVSSLFQINLPPGEIEVKQITMSLFALSKLMKTSEFTQTPYFFQVKLLAENIVYRLASASNADRTRWMESIRNVSVRNFLFSNFIFLIPRLETSCQKCKLLDENWSFSWVNYEYSGYQYVFQRSNVIRLI